MGEPGAADLTVTEGETPPRVEESNCATGGRKPGIVVVFPADADRSPSTWHIPTECSIGRKAGADIKLDDPKVSRTHAMIRPVARGFLLTDTGSRNGTYISGAPCANSQGQVGFGTLIRLANTLLVAVDDIEPYAVRPRRIAGDLVGSARDVFAGPRLSRVWDLAARVALVDHPVLVLGESGSGKEIIARLIHCTRYKKKPFVALNLAAIPDTLFEAELFGHERGSFTGAVQPRLGAFREADGGVLFLDEIGELKPDLQVKMLRALDTCRVRPIGGSDETAVRVRVVAATNRDLREAVREGRFRQDLYYRLGSVQLQVPPLRDRPEDVLLLACHMLAEESPSLRFSTDAAEVLALAPWPGNVRNLRRVIAAAAMRAAETGRALIEASDLPDLTPIDDEKTDARLTPEALRIAVLRCGGVVQKAARTLGISRSTFYNECKRLGVDPCELRRS